MHPIATVRIIWKPPSKCSDLSAVREGISLRIENELSTTEEAKGSAGFTMFYGRVPDLRCLAKMHGVRHALDGAFPRCAKVIGLELDRCESGGTRRKIGHAAIAGACVSESYEASCVEKTIGGHHRLLHGHLRPQLARADMPDDETEKAGQKIRPEFVEMCFVEHVVIQC